MSGSGESIYLRDYFDRIYWPRKLGGKPRTAALYRMVIERLGEFLERRPTLDDLNDATLCAFLQSRLAIRSAQTVDKERDKLVALATFAAKKRAIPEFPDVPQIPLPQKQPQALTLDQVDALLLAARETPGKVGDAPAGDWWYAYHLVGLLTGERTGAMHRLEWAWLRPNGCLPVPGFYRKCGKPETHWLEPVAMQAVERLRGLTPTRIFFAPFCMATFYNRNRKILKRAGLPTSRDYQPQMSRRTFATWLEAKGGDATRALNHSDRRVTTGSYLDPTIATRAPTGSVLVEAFGLV